MSVKHSTITVVMGYKTSDGFVFEKEEAAINHENANKIRKDLESLIYNTTILTTQEACAVDEFLEQYGEEVYTILKQRYEGK